MKLQQVLEQFLASDDFVEGVIKSTKASFGGSSYTVELFPDSTWRVLWASQIGNRYDSPGLIVGIPQLEDGDYQDIESVVGTDETAAMAKELRSFDGLEELANLMREAVSE